MTKQVLVAAVLAGLILFFWYFLVNGLLGFNSSINMKQAENEREIYELLSREITEPGRYTINPEVAPSEGFQLNEPVFGVFYGGVGHEAAGRHALASLPLFLILPLIAAWMLSQASDRVLASMPLKVAFVAAIGLIVGLTNHFRYFGIGGYPLGDSLKLGLHDLVLWALIGLVLAWRIKPDPVVDKATD